MAASKPKSTKPRLSAAELTDRRREEIHHAAVQVFAEHGFRDASIAQIAGQMGVGHGTIYRYFENKRAIVEYVLGRAIMRLTSVVTQEPPNVTSSAGEYREQVGRIGRALFKLIIDEPNLAAVLFFIAGEVDSELRDQVRGAFDLVAAGTELYLRNGIEKGFLDPKLDTFATACAINGMIFEGARRVHLAEDKHAEGERWTNVVQILMFDGMTIPR